MQRHDVVANPEGLDVTPLGHDGCFQLLHFVVRLRHRFIGRTSKRARQAVLIDSDDGIEQRRQQLRARPGRNQLDDIGAGDRYRLQARLHPGNRIRTESGEISAIALELRSDRFQYRPAGQYLYFRQERFGRFGRAPCGAAKRRRLARCGDL